jgi:hypothetical protein
MSSFSVTVKKEISASRIVNLLCTAFDGGFGSWGRYETHMPPEPDWSWGEGTPEETEKDWADVRKVYVASMCGGHVTMYDMEDDEKPYRLDKAALHRGMRIFAEKYPKHFSDFINYNDDAITGDVYLQCCIFGDAIYG